MAAPNTPTNFFLQSGNGIAYLSWDQSTSGATSFLIQRSQDGITFASLATITGVAQYTFTVSPLISTLSAGATYTNNSQTFTIVSSYYPGATTIQATGTGSPSTGTLVYATGSGQSSIAFSSSSSISALSNFYTDLTGVQGIQYYYQVAAMNGSGTSLYTTAQSCVIVPIGQECLGSIRMQAQWRSDFVNNTFVTTPEWNRYISQSRKELYDIILQKYGNDYYGPSTYTWTLVGPQILYPLPPDFYKSLLVEVALNQSDPNSWVTLRKFMRVEQNKWNYPSVYNFYGVTNIRYRLDGNFLHIVPSGQGGLTVRMWYAPRPSQLLADTDIIDGVSGWEEYIVIDAAIKAKGKQEDDCSLLAAEKMEILKRIEAAAENRDVGDPEVVSDSRSRNAGWGNYDGGDGNGFGDF